MYGERGWGRVAPPGPLEEHRTEARRDSARLLHSPSFRRLQGKLQLFPSGESDFFRNRLTHSLEVGQIAKSIAIRLNATEDFLKPKDLKVDIDLVELAGWCHDLGHPPFGHTGEQALDACMINNGGFEGNAQTLRILTKLEKKQHTATEGNTTGFEKGSDCRVGLNLTFRTLASILKYDNEIPFSREVDADLVKGYYSEESCIVQKIKEAILEKVTLQDSKFKTLECSIMDVADDIAYSTYDLEDAFKAQFLTPLDLISAQPEVVEKVAEGVSRKIPGFSDRQVRETLRSVFEFYFNSPEVQKISREDLVDVAYLTSKNIVENAYYRSSFTSGLVGNFIEAVRFFPNEEHPALSKVEIEEEALVKVEVLKNFTYQSLTLSPDLRVMSYRGKEIIDKLFAILAEPNSGHELLPKDIRMQYESVENTDSRKRIVCDFIAGMTDSYAVEYYGRLTSEKPQTLFKPLF